MQFGDDYMATIVIIFACQLRRPYKNHINLKLLVLINLVSEMLFTARASEVY
jgi:hypothetical protein